VQYDQGDERPSSIENSLAVRGAWQNPRSIEKKKLRLGGNGATVDIPDDRLIAEFETSGVEALVRRDGSKLRPLSDNRGRAHPKWDCGLWRQIVPG